MLHSECCLEFLQNALIITLYNIKMSTVLQARYCNNKQAT